MTRNIFDREKRESRRERTISFLAWSCFLCLALLAFDRMGIFTITPNY